MNGVHIVQWAESMGCVVMLMLIMMAITVMIPTIIAVVRYSVNREYIFIINLTVIITNLLNTKLAGLIWVTLMITAIVSKVECEIKLKA